MYSQTALPSGSSFSATGVLPEMGFPFVPTVVYCCVLAGGLCTLQPWLTETDTLVIALQASSIVLCVINVLSLGSGGATLICCLQLSTGQSILGICVPMALNNQGA